ncbi:MAG TPA: hypothetical protein EYH13_01575 [Thermococcus paralvinellae]|uniref:Uncharacterized protein n=1 Tax=Thermococcus paralvinellae TaxID=582419 RepID=A0A832ZB39_9EURY|nr:hypothetical protein [Thermococcus paralvinellae]
MPLDSFAPSPEDLEQIGYKRIMDGKTKEGLKFLIKAAKGYEEVGKLMDAARTYKYVGVVLLDRIKNPERARPFLLKSAYLHLHLIEKEIEMPEINLTKLEGFCLSVLEIFTLLNDRKNLEKYTREFAVMYEELGNSYLDNDDIESAIVAYEAAHRYYKLIGDEDGIRATAERLTDLYGKLAEQYLENEQYAEAGDTFFRLGYFVKDLFDYDSHFIEILDTAGKNYEKASKEAYAEGNLDQTAERLLKAEYAYLLARNFSRAKLIGLNVSRMLYQLASSYRSGGNFEKVGEKLIQLAEALIGIGKIEEGLDVYKTALEESGGKLDYKVRIRTALLRYLAAKKKDASILEKVEQIEFYSKRADYLKALETAEKIINELELKEIENKLYSAEGIVTG